MSACRSSSCQMPIGVALPRCTQVLVRRICTRVLLYCTKKVVLFENVFIYRYAQETALNCLKSCIFAMIWRTANKCSKKIKSAILQQIPHNCTCTGLFLSLWTFFKNTITPSFRYGIIWIFDMLLINVLCMYVIYYLFQNFDYLWPKKIICERTLKFFSSFCVGFFNFKFLKIIKKPKFGAAEKSFFFVLFMLYWKIQ